MPKDLYVEDWTDINLNPICYSMIWETHETCDSLVWENPTACNGVAKPWGFNAITQYDPVGPTNGSVRAWHFLADVGADLTQVFSIEKDDTLQIFLYEFRDKKPGTCTADGTIPYDTASGTGGCDGTNSLYEYAWYVAEVKVTGAVTHALSMAALAVVVASSFF